MNVLSMCVPSCEKAGLVRVCARNYFAGYVECPDPEMGEEVRPVDTDLL